jgi:hypothetical protein
MNIKNSKNHEEHHMPTVQLVVVEAGGSLHCPCCGRDVPLGLANGKHAQMHSLMALTLSKLGGCVRFNKDGYGHGSIFQN